MSVKGFVNEYDISGYLNGRSFSQINENMKCFIIFLNGEKTPNSNCVIHCERILGNRKADIKITFDGVSSNVSIKNDGSGHSVHQEKVSFFVDEVMGPLGATSDEISQVKKFIDSKQDGKEILNNDTAMEKTIQSFLDKNQKSILERFLKTGRNKDGFAEYLYYGTVEDGRWMKLDEMISKMIKNPIERQQNVLYVGHLTFQAWNRTNEEKRHVVQAKFGGLRTFLGG